ncbi:MAG: PhaM family polyhydroxyalkanoate granule multifunctional regulatory protein [Pseudomonadota bacterium]
MTNPAMPNLPGFGAIAESMELVRKMWGGTGSPGIGFPGMTMPSLSVEEIDKQIADLKAVEAWLTLNMNMLRGTIQALEVQSATISALKSMGEAFKNAGKAATASTNAAGAAGTTAAPTAGFSFPFACPSQPQSQEPQASTNRPAQHADTAKPAGPEMVASLADPTAWWNMLQGQFKQAVTAATASPGARGSDASAAAEPASESPDPTPKSPEAVDDAIGPSGFSSASAVHPEGFDEQAHKAEAEAPQPNSPTKRSTKAVGKPTAS